MKRPKIKIYLRQPLLPSMQEQRYNFQAEIYLMILSK